jgi:hypothetical protein
MKGRDQIRMTDAAISAFLAERDPRVTCPVEAGVLLCR